MRNTICLFSQRQLHTQTFGGEVRFRTSIRDGSRNYDEAGFFSPQRGVFGSAVIHTRKSRIEARPLTDGIDSHEISARSVSLRNQLQFDFDPISRNVELRSIVLRKRRLKYALTYGIREPIDETRIGNRP